MFAFIKRATKRWKLVLPAVDCQCDVIYNVMCMCVELSKTVAAMSMVNTNNTYMRICESESSFNVSQSMSNRLSFSSIRNVEKHIYRSNNRKTHTVSVKQKCQLTKYTRPKSESIEGIKKTWCKKSAQGQQYILFIETSFLLTLPH